MDLMSMRTWTRGLCTAYSGTLPSMSDRTSQYGAEDNATYRGTGYLQTTVIVTAFNIIYVPLTIVDRRRIVSGSMFAHDHISSSVMPVSPCRITVAKRWGQHNKSCHTYQNRHNDPFHDQSPFYFYTNKKQTPCHKALFMRIYPI